MGHLNPHLNVLNPNVHDFVHKYNYYKCRISNPYNVSMKLNPQTKSCVPLTDCNNDHLDEAHPSHMLYPNAISVYLTDTILIDNILMERRDDFSDRKCKKMIQK